MLVSDCTLAQISDSTKYDPEINGWSQGPEINDFGESKKNILILFQPFMMFSTDTRLTRGDETGAC